MGPIIQTVGMVAVTVITVAAVQSSDAPAVLDNQVDPSGIKVELVDGTVVITCGTASEVPVTLIRKDIRPVTSLVCSRQVVLLP